MSFNDVLEWNEFTYSDEGQDAGCLVNSYYLKFTDPNGDESEVYINRASSSSEFLVTSENWTGLGP